MIIRLITSVKEEAPDNIPDMVKKSQITPTENTLHFLFNKIREQNQLPSTQAKERKIPHQHTKYRRSDQVCKRQRYHTTINTRKCSQQSVAEQHETFSKRTH